MSKSLGQNIGLQFTEKITTASVLGFTIEWQELQYIGGLLINKTFSVMSLEQRGDFDIILTMHPQQRFNNVVGLVTIKYNTNIGVLAGRGGKVDSFTVILNPEDLIQKTNPHQAENITISASATVNFIKVIYHDIYETEHIMISAMATIDFIYVGVINP